MAFDILIQLCTTAPNLIGRLIEDYITNSIPESILLDLLENDSISLFILQQIHSRMMALTFHEIHPLLNNQIHPFMKSVVSLFSTLCQSQTKGMGFLILSFEKLLLDYKDAVLDSESKEFFDVSSARHVLAYILSLYSLPSPFIQCIYSGLYF